jgi:hypothetical protein
LEAEKAELPVYVEGGIVELVEQGVRLAGGGGHSYLG